MNAPFRQVEGIDSLGRRVRAALILRRAGWTFAGFFLGAAAAQMDGIDPFRGAGLAAAACAGLLLGGVWNRAFRPSFASAFRDEDSRLGAGGLLATAASLRSPKSTLEALCAQRAELFLAEPARSGKWSWVQPGWFAPPALALLVFALCVITRHDGGALPFSQRAILSALQEAESALRESRMEETLVLAQQLQAIARRVREQGNVDSISREELEEFRTRLLAVERRNLARSSPRDSGERSAGKRPDLAQLARGVGAMHKALSGLSESAPGSSGAGSGEEIPNPELQGLKSAPEPEKATAPSSWNYRIPPRFEPVVRKYFEEKR